MAKITIFGKGNMGSAIGENFAKAGNEVAYVTDKDEAGVLGPIVVLAVPYAAVPSVIAKYKDLLAGKIIVDITNPVDFKTFDSLVVPADSSAAAIIAKQLPTATVVKGFNTTFAATLVSGTVAGVTKTTVLLASDSKEAKAAVAKALENSGLAMIDVGSLKRARELEAMGFLQISLAAAGKIGWNGGFGIIG